MKDKKISINEQYAKIKNNHKDQIVFMQVGDFYEVFNEDADNVSKLLNINLTKRSGSKIPMCGIPISNMEIYLSKLLKQNKKIALYEQIEDGNTYTRQLKQIYTPGTIVDESLLENNSNNYLACIYQKHGEFAISCCDLSVGNIMLQRIEKEQIDTILNQYQPSEIILDYSFDIKTLSQIWHHKLTFLDFQEKEFNSEEIIMHNFNNDSVIYNHILNTFDQFEIQGLTHILAYISDNHRKIHFKFNPPKKILNQNHMYIHHTAQTSLELTQSLSGKSEGGLLHIINLTKTALGNRYLKDQIFKPLTEKTKIENRLNVVEFLINQKQIRESIIASLEKIHDIERSLNRIYTKCHKKTDFLNLSQSLGHFLTLFNHEMPLINYYLKYKPATLDLHRLIQSTLNNTEDSALSRNKTQEYNLLNKQYEDNMKHIYQMEKNYQQETSASSLKIKQISGLGYVIELPKKQADSMPYKFQLLQSLSIAKRYTTVSLTDTNIQLKQIITRLSDIEEEILSELGAEITSNKEVLNKACELISMIDMFSSFAVASENNNYSKPMISQSNSMQIINGKHPVLYKKKQKDFIPNDCKLDSNHSAMMLTGPNMSGKSTYMKQNAQIVVLAQLGCFVPADHAVIGIADAIYTRLGSYDDISQDKSTFMCEMSELSYILHNSTEKSLLIIDEIGRGTTCKEGAAIAQAVLEYLCTTLKARTLFATHFHEIQHLKNKHKNLQLKHMKVESLSVTDLKYKYNLIDGISTCSYGLAVAKTAKLPDSIIQKALENIAK